MVKRLYSALDLLLLIEWTVIRLAAVHFRLCSTTLVSKRAAAFWPSVVVIACAAPKSWSLSERHNKGNCYASERYTCDDKQNGDFNRSQVTLLVVWL